MATRKKNHETSAVAQRAVSIGRRAAGRRSLAVFAQIYFSQQLDLPPSRMHCDLFQRLQEATAKRLVNLAVAGPRGHGKTIIVSFVYVLWCILYTRERYIVIICNNADLANEKLASIKAALQDNPRLREDFPEVCEHGIPWRQDSIVTANGVKVVALGAEKKIRGRLYKGHRPTLIILDDVENEVEVRSEDLRAKRREWFERSVQKAGGPTTNLVLIGTILHHDSLLARHVDPNKMSGCNGQIYRAIVSEPTHPELWEQWERIFNGLEQYEGRTHAQAANAFLQANRVAMEAGVELLWPQRWTYEQLRIMLVTQGRASFAAEMQNEPYNSETCIYQEDDFHYWTDEFGSLDQLVKHVGQHAVIYGGCDPSLGRPGRRADDTAIIILLKDCRTGILYVIESDIRRRQPDNILETILTYHRTYNFALLGFETVLFQAVLASQLRKLSRRRGLYLPIHELNTITDKRARFERLQPLMREGTIRFSRAHTRLLDQMFQAPDGAHDDGPDALEMGVTVAQQRRKRQMRYVPFVTTLQLRSRRDRWRPWNGSFLNP